MSAAPMILVANHDEEYLDMIREFLTDAGYPMVVTAAGDRAYAQALQSQPHVILLDVNLSDPDSAWNNLNRLKLDPRTAQIPVILCSTDPSLFLAKRKVLAAKGCSFLEKPYFLEDLLDALEPLIGSPELP